MDVFDDGNNCEFEYGNTNPEFLFDINQHADKINDETLTKENASHISEVSTNEKSKNN